MLAATTVMLPTTQTMNNSYKNIECTPKKLYQTIQFFPVMTRNRFALRFKALRATLEEEIHRITGGWGGSGQVPFLLAERAR
jgi:hypothetical protein